MRDSADQIVEELGREFPGMDLSGLEIAVRMGLLTKRFRSVLQKTLKELGLDVWEFEVLAALRRQGAPYQLSPSELARLVLLTTGAVTNRIDRLEARDLVIREPDPRDRRAIRVCLTQEGAQLAEQAFVARSEVAAGAVRFLNDREKQMLEDLLRKLVLS